jgi:hypothetical protein
VSERTVIGDASVAFVIYCDENRLTTSEADTLAADIYEAISGAANARRAMLRTVAPELIDSEEGDT